MPPPSLGCVLKSPLPSFRVVVLPRMARNCSKVRTARAAGLFLVLRRIELLICGVVVAVAQYNSINFLLLRI